MVIAVTLRVDRVQQVHTICNLRVEPTILLFKPTEVLSQHVHFHLLKSHSFILFWSLWSPILNKQTLRTLVVHSVLSVFELFAYQSVYFIPPVSGFSAFLQHSVYEGELSYLPSANRNSHVRDGVLCAFGWVFTTGLNFAGDAPQWTLISGVLAFFQPIQLFICLSSHEHLLVFCFVSLTILLGMRSSSYDCVSVVYYYFSIYILYI